MALDLLKSNIFKNGQNEVKQYVLGANLTKKFQKEVS